MPQKKLRFIALEIFLVLSRTDGKGSDSYLKHSDDVVLKMIELPIWTVGLCFLIPKTSFAGIHWSFKLRTKLKCIIYLEYVLMLLIQ